MLQKVCIYIIQDSDHIFIVFKIYSDKKTTEKPASERFHLTALPLGRIKNIMKLDQEVNIISAESLFLITKATEFFIENMSKEAFVHTAQSKKKTLQKKDLDLAISSVDALMFLDGAVN